MNLLTAKAAVDALPVHLRRHAQALTFSRRIKPEAIHDGVPQYSLAVVRVAAEVAFAESENRSAGRHRVSAMPCEAGRSKGTATIGDRLQFAADAGTA